MADDTNFIAQIRARAEEIQAEMSSYVSVAASMGLVTFHPCRPWRRRLFAFSRCQEGHCRPPAVCPSLTATPRPEPALSATPAAQAPAIMVPSIAVVARSLLAAPGRTAPATPAIRSGS